MRTQPSPFSNRPTDLLDRQMRVLEERTGKVRYSSIGQFQVSGVEYSIPRLRLCDSHATDPIRIAVFGAIHGDEAVGAYSLVEFFSELSSNDQDTRGYEIIGYPVCNPTGLDSKTRHNFEGKDLNREFWSQSKLPEVQILERELQSQKFHGIIALHADDTSLGVYGFVQGATLHDDLLRPGLRAAGDILPVNESEVIDGFMAFDGLIRDCYPGVLSAPPEQTIRPFELIFETPGEALLHRQVQATKAFLYSVLRTYRGFISYAQDL